MPNENTTRKSAAKEGFSPISGQIKLFSCRGNRPLAKDIAKCLDMPLGDTTAIDFSDGEIFTKVDNIVRSADCYVIQSTGLSFAEDPDSGEIISQYSINDMIMELLIMIDSMKRASAGTINAVIPYFGYARQDRKAGAREPISAKLMANLLEKAGADRIITMDLHSMQIQGFFDIPVDHLLGMNIFADYYKKKFAGNLREFTVVSPDVGSVVKARSLAKALDVPLVIIDKQRTGFDKVEVSNVIGAIAGKTAIIPDDLISTAGTLTAGAQLLESKGAKEIYACCTHALLTGPAIKRIENSSIKEVAVLDTIKLSEEKRTDKIKVLSSAKLFAEAIQRIHDGQSVSEMFQT